MDKMTQARFKDLILGFDVTKEEIIKYTRATSCRVLYPTSIMTMDYRIDRVNIHIDENNKITSINMG